MKNLLLNGLASFSLCLCMCAPIASAQDEVESTPAQLEEVVEAEERIPEFFEFDTTGFSFDIELFQQPVVRENSNNSLYAVTIQRRAPDGAPLGTDGLMAFVRMTQTIDPIRENGTIEDLQNATIEDAMRAINNAYGDLKRLESVPCSYEILGEVRTGTRINVGYLQIGVNVYVECYSFLTESGNGVGITIKYHEADGEEIPRDALLADQILAGLDVHPVTPDSYFIHSLNSYPIRIPVRSSIKGARKVNKFVTEATIAYLNSSLRFQMIEIPEGADGSRVARDQLKGYEMALGQQRDRGQIEILWEAQSSVPAGDHAEAVLPGLTHAIRMNGQDFLSTMYAAVDQNAVIVANFSGSIEHAETMSKYASEFFQRPLSSAKPSLTRDDLGDASFARPRGLQLDHDDAGNLIYSTTPDADSYTIVRVLDATGTIKSALAESFPHGFTRDTSVDVTTDSFVLEDAREVSSAQITGHKLDESGYEQPTHLTGYLVPLADSDAKILLVAVSPSQAHSAQTIVTRGLLDRFVTDTNNELDLGFAKLTHGSTLITRSSFPSGRDEISLTSGESTLSIRTLPLSEGSDRSTEAMNSSYLIPAWTGMNPPVNADESESISATETEFLGHAAGMIENENSRVIGFIFEDSYVVVSVHAADSSIDALLSMLSSN